MRLFLAINLADEIKDIISDNLINLKREIKTNLKWVNRDNMHITLKFLGQVNDDSVDTIIKKIGFIAKKRQQQSVTTEGIAAFPHLDYPGVIYIGLANEADCVIDLHANIESELKEMGFKSDRNLYIPHITIARTGNNTDKKQLSHQLREYIENNKTRVFSDIDILIKGISLMKSTLKKSGPIYEEIYFAKLK